ncbi:MAG: ABC transporter substrate-binding protein, partial [Casimicrobiaceae bacterium]
GSRTSFGGHAYDAWLLLTKAVPVALQKAQPGTAEFHAALRDALEHTTVIGTNGVFTMTPQDHNGMDNRARVMVRIENGKWILVK